MTNEELKVVAWAIREGCGLQGMAAEEAMHAFECAATPDVLLRLLADNERLTGCEDVLRQLASYVGAGGYNAPEVDPEVFARKILDGINVLNDPMAQLALKKGKEIEGLKADNDQLHGECNDHMAVIGRQLQEIEQLKAELLDAKDASRGLSWAFGEIRGERDALKAECEGLRKALHSLLDSDIGMQTAYELESGKGTDTPDGQAWLAAARLAGQGGQSNG